MLFLRQIFLRQFTVFSIRCSFVSVVFASSINTMFKHSGDYEGEVVIDNVARAAADG